MRTQSVVVTGIGIVSSIGIGREEFFASLAEGRTKTGAIENFRVQDYLETQKTYLDRCSAYALAACALALKDASRDGGHGVHDASRTGLCLGTAVGCLQTMSDYFSKVLQRGPKFANSLLFSHSYANTPTSLLAIEFNLAGYHSTMTCGNNSGQIALMQAADAIRLGYADRMIAGGVDVLSEPLLKVWRNVYGNRVEGEGAVFLVLERSDRVEAERRQGQVLAEVNPNCVNDASPAPSETSRVEGLIGYAQGAQGAFEVAAAVERITAGESETIELLSKDVGSVIRVQVSKPVWSNGVVG